ncbi:PLP-dependent aminotransferase family protein [Nonomuraea typhae]|uniref:PLP-dependent aminotransferase family protein n=1 Tax=Nonomuraea typhae TaxID=2603600 RepID=A0ABW7YPI0_9ACTN
MQKHWASSQVDLLVELPAAGGRRAALEHALREAVRARRLAPGALLPSTRALAAQLGLSRGTVSAAYDQLIAEGHLTARPGSGTRVAPAAETPGPAPADARPRPDPVLHDLRPGRPDLSAFPARAWLTATRRVLAGSLTGVFAAGDPQGRPELRAALAAYLGRARGVLASPDQIVVTAGFYQGLALISRVLDGRPVAMEDPGHNVYREVVRRAALPVVPLPVDADGARTDALTGEHGAAVVTPSHQYPTGVPLHPARRQALRDWARDAGALIVEDDYDGEFRYDRQPVGALQGIAPGRTIYCGTASKTLAPGLRLAWLVAPRQLVAPIVAAKEEADLYTESLGQLVLGDLIATHGYDRAIRSARARYRRRRDLLLSGLREFPALTPHGVPAGLHTLVTGLPCEEAALAACAAGGVAVRGLKELYHRPGGGRDGLLAGFAAPSDRAYPTALRALFSALSGRRRPAGPPGRDRDRCP